VRYERGLGREEARGRRERELGLAVDIQRSGVVARIPNTGSCWEKTSRSYIGFPVGPGLIQWKPNLAYYGGNDVFVFVGMFNVQEARHEKSFGTL
jgi:hypothetical protein